MGYQQFNDGSSFRLVGKPEKVITLIYHVQTVPYVGKSEVFLCIQIVWIDLFQLGKGFFTEAGTVVFLSQLYAPESFFLIPAAAYLQFLKVVLIELIPKLMHVVVKYFTVHLI